MESVESTANAWSASQESITGDLGLSPSVHGTEALPTVKKSGAKSLKLKAFWVLEVNGGAKFTLF